VAKLQDEKQQFATLEAHNTSLWQIE